MAKERSIDVQTSLGQKMLSVAKSQPMNSHFWKGLMWVKEILLQFGEFQISKGKTVCFGENKWCGDMALCYKLPRLFYIVQNKHVTVASALGATLGNTDAPKTARIGGWIPPDTRKYVSDTYRNDFLF
ncbi:hypothetical protein BRADI_4g22412v3 [Brachypodium distachyon]|uniref:Uncharacterized protein n=1 Tax=Brachypodium distachyon TaxID=15368 RepID=A0A2K2CPG0_BRADI|nr:hypothetical protein BRADI_4g22412v3 [Brachypodium distachyon]